MSCEKAKTPAKEPSEGLIGKSYKQIMDIQYINKEQNGYWKNKQSHILLIEMFLSYGFS